MRIAFPWRPIPPAPTGVAFLSQRGLEVAAVEIVYFLPLALLSCSPSLARLRRWGARMIAFFRRDVEARAALAAPLPVAVFNPRRTAFQLGGIVAAVAATLALAQVYLRESRVVAWIEQSTHESLAVSMGRRPPSKRHVR
jgi:hypothetical protein